MCRAYPAPGLKQSRHSPVKPDNSQPPSPSLGRKLAVVAAVVAFTTGLSGYFMGQHQTDRSAAHRRAGGGARLTSG